MTDTTNVFCPGCGGKLHPAEVVTRDEHGWANEVRLLGPHAEPERTREDVMNDIGRAGGQAFSIAASAGRWAEVENILARVLGMNDGRPDEG